MYVDCVALRCIYAVFTRDYDVATTVGGSTTGRNCSRGAVAAQALPDVAGRHGDECDRRHHCHPHQGRCAAVLILTASRVLGWEARLVHGWMIDLIDVH